MILSNSTNRVDELVVGTAADVLNGKPARRACPESSRFRTGFRCCPPGLDPASPRNVDLLDQASASREYVRGERYTTLWWLVQLKRSARGIRALYLIGTASGCERVRSWIGSTVQRPRLGESRTAPQWSSSDACGGAKRPLVRSSPLSGSRVASALAARPDLVSSGGGAGNRTEAGPEQESSAGRS